KYIFGGSILTTGLLTLLTPIAARTHVILLIVIRVLIGACSGPLYPSAGALWGRWVPPLERSTIPSTAATGANVGIIVSTPLISLLCASSFLGGWPSGFYVFGCLSSIWFAGWYFFGYSSPAVHPRISSEEKLYLMKYSSRLKKHRRTPWKDIIQCVPLYGIATLSICVNYVYYTLLTSLPIYFATILNLDLDQNGFLFAMPYLCQSLVTVCVGHTIQRIRKNTKLTITNIRRVPTIIGWLETVAQALMGFLSVSALISHLDIAPNYAGTLIGITNTLNAIPGFVGPMMVGAITNDNQTLHAWKMIFNLSAAIGMFGCLVFCLLFRGEEQHWNHHRRDTNADKTVIQ
ncbi:unnamed protein product, partial [Didymodactylos carnosus]